MTIYRKSLYNQQYGVFARDRASISLRKKRTSRTAETRRWNYLHGAENVFG